MKNFRRTFILFFCTAVIAACGGSGSSGGSGENVEPITAPYTGTYEVESLISTTTAYSGTLDSGNCDPFKAELSYSPGQALVKYQCGYDYTSVYYYIDSEDAVSWISCEDPVFEVTGDYTAEISFSCTSIENDIYYAEAAIRKIDNSFTVLVDEPYWEDAGDDNF